MRFCMLAVILSVITTCSAFAAPIGDALAVERDVSGTLGAVTARLDLGDSLAQNELIATAKSSSTTHQFLDRTELMVGPSSRMNLDRFVYNPDSTAETISLDLLRGFRFVSGNWDHNSYILATPQAVISVRGTIVGIFVESSKTTVRLKQGAITVCVRARRAGSCQNVDALEDIVVITARGVSKPTSRRGMAPDFSLWCKDGKATCGLP